MAKYLVKANYTPGAGVKGLIQDGGSGRVAAVKALLGSVGGSVESFYFAFGETDAYVIVDVPDATVGASLSLTVNASGLATCSVVPLLTAEEMDKAAKMSPSYDAPGPTA